MISSHPNAFECAYDGNFAGCRCDRKRRSSSVVPLAFEKLKSFCYGINRLCSVEGRTGDRLL